MVGVGVGGASAGEEEDSDEEEVEPGAEGEEDGVEEAGGEGVGVEGGEGALLGVEVELAVLRGEGWEGRAGKGRIGRTDETLRSVFAERHHRRSFLDLLL